ncbi:MAG: MurR/RpiR family transcriptional regulator [Lachnospiraceae bacterium]|jgi:DNA-binding MurR/RpiR family transcriptional regulator|nr:MurR/RpiR family transcriptional regulator [Lachnospiraceae bacterium]HBV85011.1 N-acetylmannosamine kinase [Lachnospiraceae bacterium]
MDETYDTISRINEKFNKMSKSHKKLATFVIDHYEQAAFMTAAKMAKTVGISEATVVRFAYALEYEGYPEFQASLADWVKKRLNSVQSIGAKYGSSTQAEILTSVLSADIEKIEDTMEHIDAQAFEAAIDIILGAKHVYIIGLRSCKPIAQFLHFYLNMIRGDVNLIDSTSTSETFEQMLRINEKDVVIGISFPRYSMRTLKAMEMANDKNAKVVTITDTIHSPMCLYSSCNLLARSDMVSIVDSLVAPLSIINALVVAMCLKKPDDVRRNLESLEYAWDNYQVYLKDEIDFIDEEMLNVPLQAQMARRRKR